MSSVFRAVHAETNHEVALKVLTRTLAKNSTLLQRFLREAAAPRRSSTRTSWRSTIEGSTRVGTTWCSSIVAGGDFHDYIQRRGPAQPGRGHHGGQERGGRAQICGESRLDPSRCQAFQYPADAGRRIKIIDLGLALQNEFEDERVTREGTTVGTVDYMAPEQARDSRATSIQSDMYSLGCTFYYLLAGVPPFPGGDITDKLTRHAKNPPPDVRDLRPDLPAELSAILLKLMAKRPEDRFASYDDLIGAIDWIPLAGADRPPTVTLAPVYESDGAAPGYDLDATRIHKKHAEPHGNGSADASFPLVSMAELAAEDIPRAARDQPFAGSGVRDRTVIERAPRCTPKRKSRNRLGASFRTRDDGAGGPQIPVMAFVIPGTVLCLAFVILGIGLAQFHGLARECGSRCAGRRGDRRGGTV